MNNQRIHTNYIRPRFLNWTTSALLTAWVMIVMVSVEINGGVEASSVDSSTSVYQKAEPASENEFCMLSKQVLGISS
jgi:hypothetical protein